MGGSVFLQLFLLVDVFLIGALTTVAVQHAIAHFRLAKKEETPPAPSLQVHIPREVKERLIQDSQAKFKVAVERSTEELQAELGTTATQLNTALQRIGGEIVGNELERYRINLIEVRKQAELAIEGAQAELAKHQTELKAKLAEKVAAEKQLLIQQIDTKLADAVASFLIETLQHNVDLGAQSPYLSALLEEHKADFVQEVADEAPAAK